MTLGSVINNLNHWKSNKKVRNTKFDYQHDINVVIKRLEDYKKYQQAIAKENKMLKQKEKRKLEKKFRREIRRRIYSPKAVYNPYLNVYKTMLTGIDPNLMERYKPKSAYHFVEFRHIKLPKSNYQINAGQGWYGLTRAWDGFYTARRLKDDKKVILYASAIQKFSDMLDLPLPDFPAIGLSRTGYSSAKIMKEFYNSDEIVGDEEI